MTTTTIAINATNPMHIPVIIAVFLDFEDLDIEFSVLLSDDTCIEL